MVILFIQFSNVLLFQTSLHSYFCFFHREMNPLFLAQTLVSKTINNPSTITVFLSFCCLWCLFSLLIDSSICLRHCQVLGIRQWLRIHPHWGRRHLQSPSSLWKASWWYRLRLLRPWSSQIVYVHYKNIIMPGYKYLTPGCRVWVQFSRTTEP